MCTSKEPEEAETIEIQTVADRRKRRSEVLIAAWTKRPREYQLRMKKKHMSNNATMIV